MTDRARLMRVALGEAPADLVVTGGTVVNVRAETLTFRAIPELRLTARGLLHVKSQRHVAPVR